MLEGHGLKNELTAKWKDIEFYSLRNIQILKTFTSSGLTTHFVKINIDHRI